MQWISCPYWHPTCTKQGRPALMGTNKPRRTKSMRALKMCLLIFPLTLIAALPAVASNCSPFGTYTCGGSTPAEVKLGGTGTNTSLPITVVLGSNMFTVNFAGNVGKLAAGDDLIIVAIAPHGL